METPSSISKPTPSPSAKGLKSKKPPVTQKINVKGAPHGTDLGYMSGGSQGQPSPLRGHGECPAGWQGEEDISTILGHQTLSDPKDPTSPMAVNFVASNAQQFLSPPPPHMASQMDHVTSHVTVNPNGRASRPRGGGLILPAGLTQCTPPPSHPHHPLPHTPPKTLHHRPVTHLALPPPPPLYHQPPAYSPSRHNNFLPSYPSFQSGYSSLPPESRPPLPPHPSSVHFTRPPPSNRRENDATPQTNGAGPPNGSHGDYYHLARKFGETSCSSGYSSCCSPRNAGHPLRKSPSDDGSTISAAQQNNLLANSYSTFSSNSSRVSTPSNGGRGEGTHNHHHLQQPPAVHNQFLPPKTSPRGDSAQNFPLKQAVHMVEAGFGLTRLPADLGYARRQLDEMSEASERSSWFQSSHSSRYSGSEYSDDILSSDLGRHSFSKAAPLPLPNSMQDQFDAGAPLKVGGALAGMDYSPPHGSGAENDGSDHAHFQGPTSPMQMDYKTMPLFHLPPETGCIPSVALFPYFSNSQCAADAYDGLFLDGHNMMIGDMASIANTLPDETHYLEKLLDSQTN